MQEENKGDRGITDYRPGQVVSENVEGQTTKVAFKKVASTVATFLNEDREYLLTIRTMNPLATSEKVVTTVNTFLKERRHRVSFYGSQIKKVNQVQGKNSPTATNFYLYCIIFSNNSTLQL